MSATLTLAFTAALIGLLVLRELVSGLEHGRVQRARRLINVAIVPLTLVSLFGLVSRVSALSQQATMVVVPTAVPRPVTATRVPRPSAAPTAELAQEEFGVEDFANGSGSWPLRARGSWQAAIVDGAYQLRLQGQPTIGVSTGLPPGNYTLDLDVTVQQGAAGVVFLAAEPTTFYRLLLNTDSAYAIERVEQTSDTVEPLVGWTVSPAIAGPNRPNKLRIERGSDQVRFLVNGQPLTSFKLPSGPLLNRYGFTLVAPSGTGSATFDNIVGARAASTAKQKGTP